MSTMPEYIGDGLYVTYEDGPMIQVFTDRYSDREPVVRHQVYFEPQTLLNFLRYVKHAGWGEIIAKVAKER